MNWLSDEAIARLQTASVLPDLAGTRYRLIDRVGSGGMGTVYRAEDTVLRRRVALKVLDVADVRGELGARLLREAHILARLEHPGIVPVHDAGTLTDGRVFYAMKFVEGERLDRLAETIGTVSDRLRMFQRICEAVAFAHARGILHRDLKPENIMMGPFGEVLVMDWGVAKILRVGSADEGERRFGIAEPRAAAKAVEPAETEHGTVLGTPGYMAPEQARGEVENLDERADIYSLGAILQFLTCGKSGASAASAESSKASGITPKAVAAITRQAMAENPANRYGRVAELAADLERYLRGSRVSAYRENVLERAIRWGTKYRSAIGLVLAYLVVRALLLFFLRR